MPDEKSLLSSMQRMSLLSTESSESGRAAFGGGLNLPQMPADVWHGVPPTSLQGPETWDETQQQHSGVPRSDAAA